MDASRGLLSALKVEYEEEKIVDNIVSQQCRIAASVMPDSPTYHCPCKLGGPAKVLETASGKSRLDINWGGRVQCPPELGMDRFFETQPNQRKFLPDNSTHHRYSAMFINRYILNENKITYLLHFIFETGLMIKMLN